MRRRGRLWVSLGMVLAVAAGALGAPAMARFETIPDNVHPAVVKQLRQGTGRQVSVIVSKTAQAAGVETAAEELGARITSRWSLINAFAAKVPAGRVAALARLPGVRVVLLDNPMVSTGKGSGGGGGGGDGGGSTAPPPNPLANTYVPAVRADAVWNLGYKGAGVTVAVVDSGIFQADATSGDFANRMLAQQFFDPADPYIIDKFGHGTHVAGIIGGDGRNSNYSYIGIAPQVNLVSAKFSRDDGTASEKYLIDALQWLHDNKTRYNIRVVNISSTVGVKQSYKESPTSAAVEQLWRAGVVVVVSAGNRGGEDCSVCYAPANDPYVITVGAVDDASTAALTDDYRKTWSSMGTTLDGYAKPDIMAPGARIVSYMPNGALRTQAPANQVDRDYFKMGGTSMAAPVVSGAIALLLQAKPSLTPDQVKYLLRATARSYKDQPYGTPGVVDVYAAIRYNKPVSSANQGLTPSPLLDPNTGKINYSNTLWANTLWANTLWANNFQY